MPGNYGEDKQEEDTGIQECKQREESKHQKTVEKNMSELKNTILATGQEWKKERPEGNAGGSIKRDLASRLGL